MEIPIDEDWLISLHEILVHFYRKSDHPITLGYSEGMISVCVERPQTAIYNFIPFPHFLHKATVLMYSVISFHPFVDGNKRVALLATTFYLHWNGYDLAIPEDADNFTIDIAKGKYKLNDILHWLLRNSKRTPYSVLRNLFCGISMWISDKMPTLAEEFGDLLALLFFFPVGSLLFFRNKILGERK
jgi:death-on-curing protein